MKPELIEGNRNVEKGKLKQKFALLTDNYQLFDQSKNEVQMGKMQVNLAKTKENLVLSQTLSFGFNDWEIDDSEKSRIELNQSEAQNEKYYPSNMPAFLL